MVATCSRLDRVCTRCSLGWSLGHDGSSFVELAVFATSKMVGIWVGGARVRSVARQTPASVTRTTSTTHVRPRSKDIQDRLNRAMVSGRSEGMRWAANGDRNASLNYGIEREGGAAIRNNRRCGMRVKACEQLFHGVSDLPEATSGREPGRGRSHDLREVF